MKQEKEKAFKSGMVKQENFFVTFRNRKSTMRIEEVLKTNDKVRKSFGRF